nr:reverse transcriptase domain-containing protein [Tanacetum cinerariifolium]
MRTRSQSRNNFSQQEASPAIVERLHIELPFLEDQFQEDPPEDPPEVPMADNRTMAELLQAPTEGYEDAISKVRQSRAKAVVAKVSTSSSTLAISSDVTELKDMVRALLLDKKNKSSAPAHSLTPASVKAVEPNCVTCGGAHSYQNCPATNENIYRDNIQEYVSQAAATSYNQRNTSFRPQMVANQIRPPGFPPHQIIKTISIGGTISIKTKVGQKLQTQMANLTDMLSKFVSSNTASSSGSGTIPSNTITNPKEDLKGIDEPLRIEFPFLEDQFQEDPPEVPMADNRTVAELLRAPIEGYEDAIFFPPSKMTNLRNEITRFQQRFNESFYEAWECFNDLLRAYPHHGFSELHQLDIFCNALNVNDQDSLNSAAGGNFLDKMPRECLKLSRASPKFIKHELRQSLPKALLLDKKNQSSAPASSSTPAPLKAVEPNCVTCGGTHSYQNCPATSENVYRENIQEDTP